MAFGILPGLEKYNKAARRSERLSDFYKAPFVEY
jgi:hypothetical protein